MLDGEPMCAICGARLNQLTVFEHGVVKQYSCWCVDRDCAGSGVMNDAADGLVILRRACRLTESDEPYGDPDRVDRRAGPGLWSGIQSHHDAIKERLYRTRRSDEP